MTDEDLGRKVRQWLDQQGYPFEMAVGRAFRQAGWVVDHARWYKDPVTGAMREMDLVVSRYAVTDDSKASISLDVVVECKSSRSKPWVIFATVAPPISFLRSPFPGGISYDANHVRSVAKISLPKCLSPGPGGRVGHGVVAAFKDPKSGDPTAPYSAVRAVAAAVWAHDREQSDFALSMGESRPSITVSIPLLVVEGDLFEYHLDSEDDAPRLTKVERSVLLHPHDDLHRIDINIVTSSGLVAFASQLAQETDQLLSDLLPRLADVLLLHRSRRERLQARAQERGGSDYV